MFQDCRREGNGDNPLMLHGADFGYKAAVRMFCLVRAAQRIWQTTKVFL
jgi:hypothetical protein